MSLSEALSRSLLFFSQNLGIRAFISYKIGSKNARIYKYFGTFYNTGYFCDIPASYIRPQTGLGKSVHQRSFQFKTRETACFLLHVPAADERPVSADALCTRGVSGPCVCWFCMHLCRCGACSTWLLSGKNVKLLGMRPLIFRGKIS